MSSESPTFVSALIRKYFDILCEARFSAKKSNIHFP